MTISIGSLEQEIVNVTPSNDGRWYYFKPGRTLFMLAPDEGSKAIGSEYKQTWKDEGKLTSRYAVPIILVDPNETTEKKMSEGWQTQVFLSDMPKTVYKQITSIIIDNSRDHEPSEAEAAKGAKNEWFEKAFAQIAEGGKLTPGHVYAIKRTGSGKDTEYMVSVYTGKTDKHNIPAEITEPLPRPVQEIANDKTERAVAHVREVMLVNDVSASEAETVNMF